LGAQHGKLDVDLRTSALLGTPSVESVHDYYPFAIDDGGRLASMAAEWVDRMVILVAVRRFLGMDAADSRSLRYDNYVCMQHFVRRTTFAPFRRFWGMCDVNSCNVFLLLFMVLCVPISATLCKRVVLTLWHAFRFLGLSFFSSFPLFAWWSPLLSLVIEKSGNQNIGDVHSLSINRPNVYHVIAIK
jgi:hypothetical protein